MREVNTPNCGHENDLVAFLYSELNDHESRTFQAHANNCAGCSADLASFQLVRESVIGWRDESLGGVLFPAQLAESSPIRLAPQKTSALAALREFFNLAPLWMKGAVAFASILFCLFAGLAITRLQEAPPTVIVSRPSNKVVSDEEIHAQVDRLVKAELLRREQSAEKAPATTAAVNTGRGRSGQRVALGGQEVAKARRPLSKTEREQLAADLRLVSARNESDIDLLDDGINQ